MNFRVQYRNMWEEGIWSEYKKTIYLPRIDSPPPSDTVSPLLPMAIIAPSTRHRQRERELTVFLAGEPLNGVGKIFLIFYYYLSTEYFDYAVMYLNCLYSFAVKI